MAKCEKCGDIRGLPGGKCPQCWNLLPKAPDPKKLTEAEEREYQNALKKWKAQQETAEGNFRVLRFGCMPIVILVALVAQSAFVLVAPIALVFGAFTFYQSSRQMPDRAAFKQQSSEK